MKKLDFSFSKLHGTGNSFVFGDLRTPKNREQFRKAFNKISRKQLAKQICNPSTGIGADGFALFENTKKGAAVQWDFYNSDGSKAEMCGNAARCAGIYLTKGKPAKEPFHLRTGAGLIEIQVHSMDKIEVEMTEPKGLLMNQRLSVRGNSVRYDFINTGVPHAVIQVNNLDLSNKYRELARVIQNHSRFSPKGTNVTFYERIGPRSLACASFERGVADFTRACGTGAVAAAAIFSERSSAGVKKIKTRVPGGFLEVDLSWSHPHLTGPARWISDFKIMS